MYDPFKLYLHQISIFDEDIIKTSQTHLLDCEDTYSHSYFFLYLSQWTQFIMNTVLAQLYQKKLSVVIEFRL